MCRKVPYPVLGAGRVLDLVCDVAVVVVVAGADPERDRGQAAMGRRERRATRGEARASGRARQSGRAAVAESTLGCQGSGCAKVTTTSGLEMRVESDQMRRGSLTSAPCTRSRSCRPTWRACGQHTARTTQGQPSGSKTRSTVSRGEVLHERERESARARGGGFSGEAERERGGRAGGYVFLIRPSLLGSVLVGCSPDP